MVQRYEQTRKLQWYKRGAAYREAFRHLVSTITLYIIDCTITFLPTLQQPLVKNLKIPS